MQTNFSEAQLRDPSIRRSNEILRTCVHCGFCTATCPTYQILGDELDSPRGRIYLIKDMLEKGRPADAGTVKHIDRCLSCLACMSTCPSGVHYMHLVDHAREHIERTFRRNPADRLVRALLKAILPHPTRFRLALLAAKVARPFGGLVPDARLRAMLSMTPAAIPPVSRNDDPQAFPAEGERRARVVLSTGCAQKALNTDINDSTIRLLCRMGVEVVIAEGAGCCGALVHHMGDAEAGRRAAARNIDAWLKEEGGVLDAIVINASGCGTTVKDYWHMLENDELSERAARVSELAVDITELVVRLDYPEFPANAVKVAYHAACSLQHGQQIMLQPKQLLLRAGFEVVEPTDAHLCCGSAGTYNLLQPGIAANLKDMKVANIERLRPDVVATGNIGCMVQIGSGTEIPVVHTVELLDWASGGPVPGALRGSEAERRFRRRVRAN